MESELERILGMHKQYSDARPKESIGVRVFKWWKTIYRSPLESEESEGVGTFHLVHNTPKNER